jgi:2-oxo-4-hydroxy-4-carboxy-5-ureidoimidazoline decarboxylase
VAGVEIDGFNSLADDHARMLVTGCLGVARWVDEVVSARPYPDLSALRKQAHDSALELSDDELVSALSKHPRIGERLDGEDSEDSEVRSSQDEQGGVQTEHAERLREANATYEERFGHVFLIRAAGRDSDEILSELERRLDNDDAAERTESVTALRDIALLRLEQVVS